MGHQIDDAVKFCVKFGKQISLQANVPDKGNFLNKDFPSIIESNIKKYLENNSEANIYFSVNPANLKREKPQNKAGKKNTVSMNWLHLDIDLRYAQDDKKQDIPLTEEERNSRLKKKLQSIKTQANVPPPTIIIFTGGGYGLFWKLKTPKIVEGKTDKEREVFCDDLALWNLTMIKVFTDEDFKGDDGTENIDRVMRLPWTWNYPGKLKRKKGRIPKLAELIEFNEFEYTFRDFKKSEPKSSSSSSQERVNQEDLPKTNINKLGLPKYVVEWIETGEHPTKEFEHGRSGQVFNLIRYLIRKGIPRGKITTILLTENYLISEYIFERKDPYAEVDRILDQAYEKHNKEGSTPEDAIKEMNKNYAIAAIDGDCLIIREHYDSVFKRDKVSFMKPKAMNMIFADEKVLIPGGKPIPKYQFWMSHPDRRKYSDIIFDPDNSVTDNGNYNLWRGFGVKENEKGKVGCQLLLSHIKEIICNGVDENYKYILAWMAHGVQKTNEKPEVAIVMKGKEGIGKGKFINYYGKLFGSHYNPIVNQIHLTSHFNSFHKSCILLFVDEALWGGDRKHEGILKGYITEPETMIEPKGIDPFLVKSYMRLAIASNNQWVVPAGTEARRFFVLNVSDNKRENRQYFNNLDKEMKGEGPACLLYFLRKYNFSDIDIRSVPKTEALLDQKIQSLRGIERWWFDCLASGKLRDDTSNDDWESPVDGGRSWIHTVRLLKQYEVWGKNARHFYEPVGPQTMANIFKRLCPEGLQRLKKVIKYTEYDGMPKEERGKAYGFKKLDICRNMFEDLIGHKIPWEKFEEGPKIDPDDM